MMVPIRILGNASCISVAFLACSATSGVAQTHLAEEFELDALVGRAVHVEGSETYTEWLLWIGPDPDTTVFEISGLTRVLPHIEFIDGETTNAVLLDPGETAISGSPVIMSDARGFIDFEHSPLKPCRREHIIGGTTDVPAVMEIGAVYPESRASEGCWHDGVTWTGTVTRSIHVVGLETITHPELGDVEALRLDHSDIRTRVASDGSRWSEEVSDGMTWLVPGHGFARFYAFQTSESFGLWFGGGAEPFQRSESEYDSTVSLRCLADVTDDGTLNLDDLDAFVSAFLAAAWLADLDGNGSNNLDDLDAFVSAFLGGCN